MLFHEKYLLIDRTLHSETCDCDQSPNLSGRCIRCNAPLSQRCTIQFGCSQSEERSMLDTNQTISIVGIARGGQLQCTAKCCRRVLGQSGMDQSIKRISRNFKFIFHFHVSLGYSVGIGYGHRQQFGTTGETVCTEGGCHRCQKWQTCEVNRSVHVGCVVVTITVPLG